MPANFLHGVETVELSQGTRPIRAVKSSVILLVGTAPIGDLNVLTLVNNEVDAAQFGKLIPGFSIPRALKAIFDQGTGTVLVVNVFDIANHTAQVTDEVVTVASGKWKTAFAPLANIVVTNSAGTTTYVVNTDYTFDEFGNFKIVSGGAITEGQSLKVDYEKLDAAAILNSDYIGTFTPSTGVRTGLQLADIAYNTFGVRPKIIIVPGKSDQVAVAQEMIEVATEQRGHALIDAPNGTVVADVITDRGVGSGSAFDTSSTRAILCYPMLKAYDQDSDDDIVVHYSQYLAGVMSSVDFNEGYWTSPSNHEIKGITGVETVITAAINDASTEANTLNENGVVTLFSSFGTGVRTWGNRSAAWPSNTDPLNFIPVRRVADIVNESIELAMLSFLDKPINDAIIDSIRATVNAFLRTLIQRGAIVDGTCTFDPAKNPPTEIALGHLTFDINFMPPTPAERITFESLVDITLLQGLGAQQ